MLDLDKLDLEMICMALEDNSQTMQWWLDPRGGEAIPKSEDLGWAEYGDVDPEELVPIEPVPSSEAYTDMEDFVAAVRDSRARDLLGRAIAGRGAFRRFKDTLIDFPDLRESWFQFHDRRMRRRAIEWLAGEGLIEGSDAERALAQIDEPAGGGFGPPGAAEIASAVAADLGEHYGERLRKVLLFGSWARGDAHPESDIDLLVVLDPLESPWSERRAMDDILWRHSFENDAVVTAFPVADADFELGRKPVLARAKAEGVEVA